MLIKLHDKCDECGKKIKTFHMYKTKILCVVCYRRNLVIIPDVPKIFEEPLDQAISFSVTLTKSQKRMLNERVSYLFPKIKGCRVKYLRALILGDLMNWDDKRRKRNFKKH